MSKPKSLMLGVSFTVAPEEIRRHTAAAARRCVQPVHESYSTIRHAYRDHKAASGPSAARSVPPARAGCTRAERSGSSILSTLTTGARILARSRCDANPRRGAVICEPRAAGPGTRLRRRSKILSRLLFVLCAGIAALVPAPAWSQETKPQETTPRETKPPEARPQESCPRGAVGRYPGQPAGGPERDRWHDLLPPPILAARSRRGGLLPVHRQEGMRGLAAHPHPVPGQQTLRQPAHPRQGRRQGLRVPCAPPDAERGSEHARLLV